MLAGKALQLVVAAGRSCRHSVCGRCRSYRHSGWETAMAKADKGATMSRLHSAARLSRTALAARLLDHGFYAGQDQIMLALNHEDGQTPGQLATRLGVRPPTITKTINRLQAQGFLDKRASETDARQAHSSSPIPAATPSAPSRSRCARPRSRRSRGSTRRTRRRLPSCLSRIEANLSDAGSPRSTTSERRRRMSRLSRHSAHVELCGLRVPRELAQDQWRATRANADSA